MSFKEKVYRKLSPKLQDFALTIAGLEINKTRYSKTFFKYLKDFQSSYRFSRKETLDLNEQRFQELLRNIKENKNSLLRFNFLYGNIEAFKSLKDLDSFKLTSKDSLKEALKKFPFEKNEYLKNKIIKTSGTTGSGLIFPIPLDFESRQWALWWRFRLSHGIKFNQLCGYFGGRNIVNPNEKKRFYRINKSSNQVMFSAYHLNLENLENYINGIKSHNIKWLHGYPSILSDLAFLIEKSNFQDKLDIEIISTGAESLLVYQKEILERVFKCRIIEHYGLAEGTANFSIDKDDNLVVDEDYSHVKFVKNSYSNDYKIVGTSLDNFLLPMLNYDSGDTCSVIETKKDSWRKVSGIDGRVEDYLILKDGTRVGRLDHLFKDLTFINQAQIIQTKIGTCHVNLVVDKEVCDNYESLIRRSFSERMGNKISIEINIVPSIKKTASGKLRFVLNEVIDNKS